MRNKMKFEIGKEYKTRGGNTAVVLFEMPSTMCCAEYPLKGYIEWADGGGRSEEQWRDDGKYSKDPEENRHDLMPSRLEATCCFFMMWKEDSESLQCNSSLAETEKIRARRKDCGYRVSPVIAVKFTEDSAGEQ